MRLNKLRPHWFVGFILLTLLLSGCQPFNQPGMEYRQIKYHFWEFDWSPDGQKIVGATGPREVSGLFVWLQPSSEVYIWDLETNRYEMISHAGLSTQNEHPAWSPDGNQVLYSSWDEFGFEYDIGLVDVATLEQTPLVKGFKADWLGTGDQLFILDWNDIFRYTIATGEMELLWEANRGDHIWEAEVSPDGRLVAMTVSGGDPSVFMIFDLGDLSVFVSHPKSTKMVRIPYNLTWSPDSKWIIFEDYYLDLGAYSVEGDCFLPALDLGNDEFFIRDMEFSPDGSRLGILGFQNRKSGILFIDTQSEFFQNWLYSSECAPIE